MNVPEPNWANVWCRPSAATTLCAACAPPLNRTTASTGDAEREPDGQRDRLADRVEVVQVEDVLAEQPPPEVLQLAAAGVVGALRDDEVHLVLALQFADDRLDRDVLVQVVPDDLRDLAALDLRVGQLVTDHEQVAAPAALVEAVDRGVPGHEVHGQLVRLAHLAAAPAFEQDLAEVVVHPVVGLELADLQRRPVAGRVADRAEQDVRVLRVSLAQQQPEQVGKLGLQRPRDVPHRAGHVEQDPDRERLRVVVGVPALPGGHSARVEVGVDGGGAAVGVGERAGAGGRAVARPRGVDVGVPVSASHDRLLRCGRGLPRSQWGRGRWNGRKRRRP